MRTRKRAFSGIGDLDEAPPEDFHIRLRGGRADRGSNPQRAAAKLRRMGRRLGGGGLDRSRGAQHEFPAQSGSQQRVTVQANLSKHQSARTLSRHTAYLGRDGAGQDGEAAQFFDAENDGIDGKKATKEWRDDRHHFRLMLSPEHGAKLKDLPEYTRETMRQAEKDLGVPLQWVAVAHHNTGQPHVHIVLRGKEPDGRDLVIARNYISHGFRTRAQQQATLELGPRSEREQRDALEKEVSAERLTSLDRTIARRLEGGLTVDTAAMNKGRNTPHYDTLLIGRVRNLWTLGMAEQTSPNVFRLDHDWQAQLRGMGEKNDIIKTLHREGYHPDQAPPYRARDGVFEGVVATKGVANELKDTPYIVVSDGKGDARYLTLARPFDADEIRAGSIVRIGSAVPRDKDALDRAEGSAKRGYAPVQIVSSERLDGQIGAPHATHIDTELSRVEREPWHEARGGEPMQDAMEKRADYLVRHGYANRHPNGSFEFKRGKLAELRNAERERAKERIEAETGKTYRDLPQGESEARVIGVKRLSSGRELLVERKGRVALVPSPKGQNVKTGDHISVRRDPRGKPKVSKLERER